MCNHLEKGPDFLHNFIIEQCCNDIQTPLFIALVVFHESKHYIQINKGLSIDNVGNFSVFLTAPPPCRQFFSTIHRQFWPIFGPSAPFLIADVVYGLKEYVI